MFEPILQKDSHGCAVACIAMVSGYSYEYVRQYYSGKDFTKAGITFFDYAEFFVDHGISCNWKWPSWQAKGLNLKRETWPPKLWADLNLVIVMTKNDMSHVVVVKKDGSIFDPNRGDVKSFDAYREVSQVIGIYRHA